MVLMQGAGSYHRYDADLGHGAHALTCEYPLAKAPRVHFPPTPLSPLSHNILSSALYVYEDTLYPVQ
jgi:hypothetical protein